MCLLMKSECFTGFDRGITTKVFTALSLIIGEISGPNFVWAKQYSENFIKGCFQSPISKLQPQDHLQWEKSQWT